MLTSLSCLNENMDMNRYVFLLVNVLISSEGTFGQKIIDLTPFPTATVTENNDLQLTCTYSRDGACPTILQFEWWLNGAYKSTFGWTGTECVHLSGDKTLEMSCSSAGGKCSFQMTSRQWQNSQQGNKWKCISENTVSAETSILVNVPITGVQRTTPTVSQISVVENRSYSFSCFTTAGRPAATVKWYRDPISGPEVELTGAVSVLEQSGTLSATRSTLNYTATSRNTGYQIYCKAYNMGPSTSHEGSKTTVTDVQYPPVIKPLQNRAITASASLTVKCTTTLGNPAQTSYSWTRSTDNTWSLTGQTLSLYSITKVDAADYTCTARNEMIPTGGSSVDGTDTKMFTIDVLYPPVISPLQNRDVIAFAPLTVQCTATPGNPIQTSYRWTRSTDNTWSQTGQTLSLPSVTKDDAAVYTCTAWNVMTPTGVSHVNGTDTETFKVNVLCPPRAFDSVNNYTYYRSRNASVTLNLTFTAYPPPTSLQWFKQLPDVSWQNIRTGISSDHQQSNLTLQLRTQEDFGQYRIEIVNDLGKMEHFFYVSEHGLPSIPRRFRMIGSLNKTMFSWESGNNGGYQQTFIIELSVAGQNRWTEKRYINELDKSHKLQYGIFIADINGLDPGSYAARVLSSNKLGKSEASKLSLPFIVSQRMEPSTCSECYQSAPVSTGAVAGGVLAGVEAVVIVAVVFYALRLKRRYQANKDGSNQSNVASKPNNQQTTQEKNETYDNIVAASGSSEEISDAPRNVYEQLNPGLGKERVYSAIEPSNVEGRLDVGAEYINLNVYES